MGSKTFLTISRQECQKVYKEILQNSDSKWKAARALAKVGEYGSATSMAIISVEELTKALIVFLDGQGFEIRKVKGIDVVFKHHQIRYILTYAMFMMSIFGQELLKFINRIRDNPEDLINMSEEMKTDANFFEKKMKFFLFRKLILAKKEFEWFSKVDLFRQEGFYSDYEEQLKNPINIPQEDYLGVIHRLEKVRKVGTAIIEGFNTEDDSVRDQVKKLRKDFKQKDYYGKIELGLSKMRKSRESPFELIKKNLTGDH